MATKDRKVLAFPTLSQLGGRNISLFAHPKARWHACCILISIMGRSTTFGVLLQTSEDDYLGGGHDKDILGPHGTQRLECLSLQTAFYLGDRLNTRRRLVGFSLLGTIRRQTSWISPSTENVTIPPIWHLGTGQQSKLQSTRKTRGSTLSENPVEWPVEISHLEHAQCKYWGPGESFGHSPHWSHWKT